MQKNQEVLSSYACLPLKWKQLYLSGILVVVFYFLSNLAMDSFHQWEVQVLVREAKAIQSNPDFSETLKSRKVLIKQQEAHYHNELIKLRIPYSSTAIDRLDL